MPISEPQNYSIFLLMGCPTHIYPGLSNPYWPRAVQPTTWQTPQGLSNPHLGKPTQGYPTLPQQQLTFCPGLTHRKGSVHWSYFTSVLATPLLYASAGGFPTKVSTFFYIYKHTYIKTNHQLITFNSALPACESHGWPSWIPWIFPRPVGIAARIHTPLYSITPDTTPFVHTQTRHLVKASLTISTLSSLPQRASNSW